MPVIEKARVLRAERKEKGLVHELLQRCFKGIRWQVHDSGQDARNEAATDHRTRLGNRPRLGREVLEAHKDCVLDRGWHRRLADGATIRACIVAKRTEQLFDVERNPIGALVDRGDHLARRGQPGGEDEGRHQGSLIEGERREPSLLGHPLGQEPRPPFPNDRIGRELIGSIGGHDQDRVVADTPRELRHDLEAQVVRPLEVLEGQHRRRVEGFDDPADHVAYEETAGPELGAVQRIWQVQ